MSEKLTISHHQEATSVLTNETISDLHENQYQNIYQNFPIQRKLTIGSPNDQLEDEADSMADKVVSTPETDFIQRKWANCEEEEKLQRKPHPFPSFIQKKCSRCEEEEKAQRKPLASFIQKKSEANNNVVSDAVSSQIQSTKAGGIKMPEATRSFMESRFGADFSNVNIHTGSDASLLSNQLSAQAFTISSDIYFNEGKYQPESFEGKKLLAHELTHVIQQGSTQTKIQCDRNPAFSVEGLFETRDSFPNFVFFELNKPDNVVPENDLDTKEKAKITKFATDHASGVNLFGFASEEGAEAENTNLITQRIQAVKNVLTSPPVSYDPSLITTQKMLSTSKNHFDYRFWRTVEMEAAGHSSTRVQPASVSAARGLQDCSTDQQDTIVKPARDKAVNNMKDTVKAVNDFKSDKAAHKETSDALKFVFRSDSDLTTQKVIDRLNANITFLGSIIPILHCGTDQSVDCGGTAEALTNPTSITLCLPFFDPALTVDDRSSTLVHESSHGSTFLVHDRAYRRERVTNILNTKQALDNAESMAIFVETIKAGTAPSVGPAAADTTDNCGADEEMTRAAVAWAERWNTYAVFGLQQTYGNDENTAFMAPHINFYFKRSDRSALAGILDRYTKMMGFFDGGAISIECVDRTDPLYNTWKVAEWSKTERKVKISNEQLHKSYLNDDDRVKHIYGALAVDRFGATEDQRMAYPNVARAYKIFFWQIEG